MKKLFDPKCRELAEYFLASPKGVLLDEIAELASEIQDAVERHFIQADPSPCPVCGSEERTGAGYLSCECPDLSTLENRRRIAAEMIKSQPPTAA